MTRTQAGRFSGSAFMDNGGVYTRQGLSERLLYIRALR